MEGGVGVESGAGEVNGWPWLLWPLPGFGRAGGSAAAPRGLEVTGTVTLLLRRDAAGTACCRMPQPQGTSDLLTTGTTSEGGRGGCRVVRGIWRRCGGRL